MAFRAGPKESLAPLGAVAMLAIGTGGIALAITLLFLGMRAVMDVGGMCAEGGPYEIATTCPDGSAAATLLGVLGLFVFGGLTMWAGARLGGAWTGAVGLAWVALFAVLGWNFLDYGIISPPEGETIVWGWLIPGVIFEVMAFGPVVFVIWGLRAAGRPGVGPGPAAQAGGVVARALPGPRQRDRSDAVSPSFAAMEAREAAAQAAGRRKPAPGAEAHQVLAGIATAMGSAVAEAEAATLADPAMREVAGSAPGRGSGDFSEGTQALLDRLERLADMRDRGLLRTDEFETAKAAIMQELEARS